MAKRPEALVILTPAFPGDESETHWVPTQQLFVRAMQQNYPELTLIVLSFYYPYRTDEYEWRSLRVVPFNGTKRRKIRRIPFYFKIWQELEVIRRQHDLIGVFSFWCGECALAGHYFAKRYALRHYCWLCGQDAGKQNKLVKLIRPSAGELIAMSDFLADEFFRNHGIRPLHTIPNGIDPAVFPAEPVSGRDIDLLGVGSLSRLKRYDLFLDIVKTLKSSFPAIKAVHCGEGEDREKIQAAVRREGLEGNFFLLGEKPHREALGLMQRSRVFLHTSGYEGFGVVCLEALYAGAQVISFCRPMKADIPHWHIAGSPAEMISLAAGLLAAPGTDQTPVLKYTMDDTVRAVMALFRRLADESPRPAGW